MAEGLVVGIDEAGRGPWAGPVVAAAVALPPLPPAGIADSKALTRRARAAVYAALLATARIGVGAASAAEIDRLNVLAATLLAMRRAFAALGIEADRALVDGDRLPRLPCPASAIIGGDACEPAIAAASIVAKVTRDRLMARLAARYPGFGWERNAGYGTPEHRAALARLGVTPHHRRSFAPIARLLAGDG